MLTKTTGTLKNKVNKLLASALIITLCLSFPLSAKAAQVTKSVYTGTNFTHNSRFDGCTLYNAIDISEHQGTIDFVKMKKDGNTKAIIIRVGCRGYGSAGTLIKDSRFDYNISNANANGFDVGVYFYSQALNEQEAIAEANYLLPFIKNYSVNLPVYYDYEFAGVSSGRLDSAWNSGKLTRAKMSDNAIAFCETIEKAGYKAGVYGNPDFFQYKYDETLFNKGYAMWLANFTSKTSYEGEYQIWQYSPKGHVSGIASDIYVDSNYIYYEYLKPFLGKGFETSTIKKQTYTGKEIKPKFTVYYNGKALIKGEDYYVSFYNNVKIGTASVTVTGVNDYTNYRITKEYSIVPTKVTGLKLEARGSDSLEVSWDKNSTASRYYVSIYRGNSWVKAGTTNETSFVINDLANASSYKVKVRGYKKVGEKYYYGYYCPAIETSTYPVTPTELKATYVRSTSLKLSWKKQAFASYYRVYKYNTSSKKYELISEPKTNSLNITGLSPNKRYSFKVRAYKKAADGKLLYSDRSNSFAVYTSPPAPKSLSVKSPSQKKISASWSKSANASGYQIMWSTSSSFSSNYKKLSVSSTSKTVTTAQSNKTYYVRVRAYKERDGKKYYSDWSSAKSVKTK